jgi:Tfp pilus assembly protein PilN
MKPATANTARNGSRAGKPGAVAVLHEQEGKHRLLIVRRRERWEIVESRTLQSLDAAVLRPLLEEHEVAQVVRVAPGRETVARCVQVPAGDDAALAGAAMLMAEVELPAVLPPHRRAGGVLPGGMADARTALLTGWMSAGQPSAPLMDIPEVWLTPLAALAMLRGDSGRSAAYCEPGEGLICVLVPGQDRTVARVLVEEPGDTWPEAFARAVVEAQQIAGAGAPESPLLTANGKRLLLEPGAAANLKVRIAGVREDSGWLDDFGLALGAALVAGSDLASVRSLATLHAQAPRPRLSTVETATRWLAQPRNAWAVTAASLAIMLLAPMGLAYGRAVLLESRAEKLKTLKVGREGVEKKAAMYEQLEKSRWPMTKLLADVSTATPMGVTVSTLTLNVGQVMTVKGTAGSSEDLTKFQANLNATRVFGNVSITRQVAKGGEYEFDVSARVMSNPHVPVKLTEENDFAKRPLAERLYGEGASNTVPASTGESRGSTDRPRRRPEARTSGDAASSPSSEPRRPAETKAAAVPPPLTDADIAKMDRTAAMREWSSRQAYVQKNPQLDAATKQRLSDEANKCKEQMQKATAAPTPAPGGAK